MFKNIALLFISFYAVTASFFFTVPTASSWWISGDSITLHWETPDNNQLLQFTLVRGDPNNLSTVAWLGSAPIGAKFVSVKLPNNLPSGTDYAIKGQGAWDVNYSHTFTIRAKP